MAKHVEPLAGGLVTNRDPALLEAGQLSSMRNMVYRPGIQAPTRATGRSVFGTASAASANVDGLRDVKFDNGDHFLIAMLNTGRYRYATVGASGTFADLATITAGSQLDAVHFRNRFYLLNGVAPDTVSASGSNLVVYLSATAAPQVPVTRQHGMQPVRDAPGVTTAAGTFSQTVTGYYEYWTTELAKLTQDGAEFSMESTFVGTPTTVAVLTTTTVPTIQLPIIRNSITTHWRVYRSTKKDAEKDVRFPIGFMIAEKQILTATASATDNTVADTLTVTGTGYKFPGSFNSGGNKFADFTNATTLSADNAVNATVTGTALTSIKSQGTYNYNFGGFTGSVKGIEVVVEAAKSAGANIILGVTVGRNRQADGGFTPPSLNNLPNFAGQAFLERHTSSKSLLVTGTSIGAYTFGSSTDRWQPPKGAPFVDSDFGANFMVVLNAGMVNGAVLSVDYVKVQVHYAATIDSVVPFPTVSYTFGDISAEVGKNGPPASAKTGDVYEDTLVTNDATNPSMIRYSYPGDPEAFPETYYLDFETSENDRVNLVKVVNNRLVVGLDTSIWRVNYLPSERDSSFDRGKAKEPISSSYGCVDPMCAAVYSPDGGPELLAFVSHSGIHSTDGYSFTTLTDLKWSEIIPTGATPIALINDPEKAELIFYFRNDSFDANDTYLALHLSYHPDHQLPNGRLKCSGLVHMRNYESGATFASLESAWSVRRSNGSTSVYLGYGGSSVTAGAGRVYIASGTDIPAYDTRSQYTTRRMYLAGFGKEWELGEVLNYSSVMDAQSLTYSAAVSKTNRASAEVAAATKSLSVAGPGFHRVPFGQVAEGMRLTVAQAASATGNWVNEFLVLDGKDFGDEDSGR